MREVVTKAFSSSVGVVACAFMFLAQAHAADRNLAHVSLYPSTAALRVELKRALREDAKKLRAMKKLCKGKTLSSKKSNCDFDHDRIVNRREKLLGLNLKNFDTDFDGTHDRDELIKFKTDPRKADSDGNGVPDGNEDLNINGIDDEDEDDKPGEGSTYEDEDDNLSPTGACSEPNFDSAGNTTQFGIPVPLVGNKNQGASEYSTNCARCHIGIEKGANYPYLNLYTAVRGAPMYLTSLTEQQISDITAFLSRTQTDRALNCTPTPTATPTVGPTATPVAPTPTPIAMPTGTPCPGSNFDANQNTTQAGNTQFGIPSNLTGNIAAGQAKYFQTCGIGPCHGSTERGGSFSYTQLKAAVTGPLMQITTVTDPEFANLVAFLRRAEVGGNCGGPTPTPTATPNPATYGAMIFASSCSASQCHAIGSSGRPREMDSHPSRHKIHEALWSGPDDMPQFRQFTLGQTAPPYSAQEEALFQYLSSLP